MTTESFKTTVLAADAGKYLTQAADMELSQRTVATRVALGKYSTPADWKEISKEEADEIIAAKKAEQPQPND